MRVVEVGIHPALACAWRFGFTLSRDQIMSSSQLTCDTISKQSSAGRETGDLGLGVPSSSSSGFYK